jgi:hypothetical protein
VIVYVHHVEDGKPVLVAEVDAPTATVEAALDYAWRWTNNIEGSWSMGPELGSPFGAIDENRDHNPNVTVRAPLRVANGRTYGLRSSMVGDVFCIGDEMCNVAHVVASSGFQRITDWAPQ